MKQMGVNFDGRFKQWKADAVFDPAAPDKAKADVDVDLASIDLASADSEAIQFEIYDDQTEYGANEGYSINEIALEAGVKRGLFRHGSAKTISGA